jgi:UDP-N-acetylglucosamine 1-carboxyvinyltransferase
MFFGSQTEITLYARWKKSTIKITSVDDMVKLSNSGESYNGTTILLMNDITLGSNWTSIGACIKVEGNTAIIDGVEKFTGAEVSAPDLRAGAALVIAGLAAEGVTVVDDIVYILRGYEDFDGKLRGLGAEIERVNNAKDIQKFRLRA